VKHIIVVSLAGFQLLLAGCNKPHDRSEAVPLASAGRAEAQRPTAPRAENPRDINALFQVESENRPLGGLRVEDALAAFRSAGIELHAERQHLARPYGARYCMGAKSGSELVLSVCEYVDAAAAEAGVTVSRKIPLKDREIRVRRASSLTVRLLQKTPQSEALAARLFERFTKL
jgi:hypothetical protein